MADEPEQTRVEAVEVPPKARQPVVLAPGAVVGDYRVIRKIGRGGMGEVFLARDVILGRRVALKLISSDSLEEAEAKERFLKEARATAVFSHPNIVTIYGVGQADGRPFMALEYVEGETLAQRMEAEPPTVADAIRYALAIAQALEEAHRHQILHRDLKPANVLLGKDGRVRVVDFGLAKALGDADRLVPPAAASSVIVADDLKRSSDKWGTPAYMSPEQWRGRDVDGASDVWAVGLILYQLLAGRLPWVELPARLGELVGGDEPVPPLPPGRTPPAVAELTLRCLAKDRRGRPSAAELAAALGQLAHGRARVSEEESPFRGLAAFSEQHAASFFGRDAEVAAFVERLREAPLLPVIGPSGAGKSSFVQAGVIPRLKASGPWRALVFRPGAAPFQALAARLLSSDPTHTSTQVGTDAHGRARAAELAERLRASPPLLGLELGTLAESLHGKVLLAVDQLEEAYTLTNDRDTCERFVEALCLAGDDPEAPVRVVFTLRDDFLSRVVVSQKARQAMGQFAVLPTPGREALVEILTRPLDGTGYAYDDPALVDDMVTAVASEPAALPLLQFTCHLLWERRDRERKQLTRARYDEIGGVAGALATHGDTVLSGLPQGELDLARRLLLRLVTSQGTRQVMARGALLEGLPDGAAPVLERLTQSRLISVRRSRARDVEELELAHESLVQHWRQLAQWLDESREELVLRAELTQAAEMWVKRGRLEAETWQGDALRDVVRKVERHGLELGDAARAFLLAGRRREERQRRRRRRILGAAVAGLTAVAAASVVVALALHDKERRAQAERARAERRRAEAQRESAVAALGRGAVVEARAKIREALETHDDADGRAVWWRLQAEPMVWKVDAGGYTVALSPDGTLAAVGGMDGAVHVIDVATGIDRVLRVPPGEITQGVEFSPDGATIVSGSTRLTASGKGHVRLWRVADGSVTELEGDHNGMSASFSPDGQRVIAGDALGVTRVYDVATRKLALELPGHEGPVFDAKFTRDGRHLLTVGLDGFIRVRDAATGQVEKALAAHHGAILGIDVRADGELAATAGGDDHALKLWRLPDLTPVRTILATEGQSRARFSLDGTRLASGGWDRTVHVWDVGTGAALRAFPGAGHAVYGLAFTRDGRAVIASDWTGTTRRWDLDAGAAAGAGASAGAQRIPCTEDSLAVRPQGGELALGCVEGYALLVDAATHAPERKVGAHTAAVQRVAFSPDGELLATASADRTVGLWRTSDGSAVHMLVGHSNEVRLATFSNDGRFLATASFRTELMLWDVATGSQLWAFPVTKPIASVGFSPDGTRVLTSSWDHTVKELDRATGKVLRSLEFDDWLAGARYFPDGKRAVTLVVNGKLAVWDTARLTKLASTEVPGGGNGLAVSGDGRRLLVSSPGRCAVLDAASLATLRTVPCDAAPLWAPDGEGFYALVGTAFAAFGGDGQRRWRTSLAFAQQATLRTHRGWLGPSGAAIPPPEAPWRAAADAADGGVASRFGDTVCLKGSGTLQVWQGEHPHHERILGERLAEAALVATSGACFALVGTDLWRVGADGDDRVVARDVGGVAPTDDDDLVIWDDARAFVLDARTGEQRLLGQLDHSVTAIALDRPGDPALIGFADGVLARAALAPARFHADLDFSGSPRAPVRRLARGPAGTVVAGYADGHVVVFSEATGRKLHEVQLEGPIDHLFVSSPRVVAASALGDVESIDLSILERDRCALMREIWSAVPVVWSETGPVRRAPPADHPCARPAASR